jgi:hypothetical protein
MDDITFYSEFEDPFVDYALELISSFCRLKIERVPEMEKSEICYTNRSWNNTKLAIHRVDKYDLATIPCVIKEEYTQAAHHKDLPFPFDIFTALRFWMTDEANGDNVPKEGFDIHERLLCKYSAQFKKGVCLKPVVNLYLSLFKTWIIVRLKRKVGSYLPPGKKCMIILTHDVDNPVNPSDLYHWCHSLKSLLHNGMIMHAIRETRFFLINKLRRRRDRHWLFHEVMEAEAKLGFTSTIFFSVKSNKDMNSSPFDVVYQISFPKFKKIIKEILDRGFEVGLHISYNAHRKADYIIDEKQILEKIAVSNIKGSRHHLWKMKQPFWSTLEDHAKSQLRYDTSIAFNDHPGYRLGIALPFFPWNPEKLQKIPVVQIPTVLMDGAFFYEKRMSPEEVLFNFKPILKELKEYEGAACIDWHIRTSYPGSKEFEAWGKGYLALIKFLSKDSEIYVSNAEQAYRTCLESWPK